MSLFTMFLLGVIWTLVAILYEIIEALGGIWGPKRFQSDSLFKKVLLFPATLCGMILLAITK